MPVRFARHALLEFRRGTDIRGPRREPLSGHYATATRESGSQQRQHLRDAEIPWSLALRCRSGLLDYAHEDPIHTDASEKAGGPDPAAYGLTSSFGDWDMTD